MNNDDSSDDQGKTASTKATGLGTGIEELQIQQLFKLMVENHASDLHLSPGSPPGMRVHGDIIKVKIKPLTKNDTKRLTYQVLTDHQRNELEKNLELDFSFGIKDLARFRANVYFAKGGISAVFRQIPSLIPDFKTLNLPNVMMEMTNISNGLILITGPTGSGKSTTLASMLDRLNETTQGHIITLEDPIEFVHGHKGCLVNQREIGADTLTFKQGLKSLLRQDPDIVLVGELRDMETIEAALTIAETGHLVFGTLHTNSAVQTINRMINVFPSHQQTQIRTLLSFVLQGVVSQQLIPKSFGAGRSLALEILIPNSAIRNLIREDKTHQIYSQMQIGQEKSGMVTMNQSLIQLIERGQIDADRAMSYATEPEELISMLANLNNKKKR